jgi:membrane-associated PAP2 superfamily phosphatase
MGGDKMRRFIMYLLWSLFIIAILYLCARMTTVLNLQMKKTFNGDSYFIFSWLFPILLGMLLRLPQLLQHIIQKRPWSFDWIKLIAIGLPLLYVSSIPLMYIGVPGIHSEFAIAFTITNMTGPQIAGVILGYIILDSLKEK